ncbi:MAG: bifunctional (p)ppGpp synthetase/guanosine-3',5'-bis(diphosphate) 3'-pyrophosphohydrolase, partial [Bacteroidales bacterium]|nr:bifunctional (p)ppGpp synthetase/guanosine-3',5'-bis(diphosphate) 3'-pyrophosphohydrolase [Bacteroidales bacterium]
PLKDRLTKEGIEYTLKARTKSAYSIWCKMQKQGIPFDKVYDVFAIRFIVKADLDKEKDICWNVYSLVTEEYEPDISRLRDWITVPKPNGYQSLHTTVKNKHGNAIEVQIRTERMDNEAEMGIASHWAYKGVKGETGLKDWMDRMHNLINNPQTADLSDQEDHVETVLQDVFAFTPDGELRQLRAGATVLDFAFEIHSNIGLKCTGGKVNGKMVSIKEKIKTGDVIEIITGRNQTPNADWLDFVVTSKAKSKIRQKLKETENKLAKAGKEMLERRLKNWKIALNDELMFQLIRHYKFKTANEFFGAVGGNVIDVADIKAFITQQNADQEREKEDATKQKTAGTARKEESSDYIEIGGMRQLKNLDYKMAKCCNPVFGDEVFGFVTVKEGIKIHRICCTNAYRLLNNYPHRIQKIRWKNDSQTSSFQTSLKIVVDQESASNAVLAAISPFNASIRSFKIHERASKHDWEMEVVLHVSSNTLLEKIMATVKKLRDVKQITRE